jgi:hypothetical protein
MVWLLDEPGDPAAIGLHNAVSRGVLQFLRCKDDVLLPPDESAKIMRRNERIAV